MKKIPSLTVITVCLNAEELLEKTILSVVQQSYHNNIEYIIIDGGSTDETLSIIKKYEPQISKYISEADKGIYDAMNKGMRLAGGDYILFLNAGDVLSSKTIVEELFSEQGSSADVIYGETFLTNKKGELLGTRSELTTRKLPAQLSADSLKHGMVVCHQSFIVKKSIAPFYNLNYRISSDVDWMIRVLKKSKSTVNVNRVISCFLLGGISKKRKKQSLKERFIIMKHHYGFFATVCLHIGFAVRFIKFSAQTFFRDTKN